MRIKNIWMIVLSLVGYGCASMNAPTPLEEAKAQVIATERAFAKTMADRDHRAFATFIADDTVFFSGPKPLHGKQQVVDFWAQFYTAPSAPFSWEPREVEVLPSGDLAMSFGPVHDAAGKRTGTFTSVWRKQGPNTWKIIFDKGDQICQCATPAP